MIQFPNGKINLGLSIVRKRADGFHDLESVFYPIAMHDALEFVESSEMTFTCSGLEVSGTRHDNLVWKAYQLLKEDFPALPDLNIHLLKRIPMGAGLGGGSADAAFMLTMLNRFRELGLDREQLKAYASQLGSDCPFFIVNQPCFATGRGEVLQPIELDLIGYKMILAISKIHVNTREAFGMISPALPSIHVNEVIQQPITEWKDKLKNDFEGPVFDMHPSLRRLKDTLYRAGASYSAMSGSGSTLFAIVAQEAIDSFRRYLSEHPVEGDVLFFYL